MPHRESVTEKGGLCGWIDGWMTPLFPTPAVSSLPDFPTLPPVPWRPARRTARWRRRKTTTKREPKVPS